MTVITIKDTCPVAEHIKQLKIWQRDSKKYQQTALYSLLSESLDIIKKQQKAMAAEGREIREGFTRNAADAAFSDYIRARAGHKCEKCGKHYPAKSTGLQCSHNYSRRHHNIRYHPDNALALCHHCHNYWYSKDIPEAARFLEAKIGKERIAELERLKAQPNRKHSAAELDEIAEHYRAETAKLEKAK